MYFVNIMKHIPFYLALGLFFILISVKMLREGIEGRPNIPVNPLASLTAPPPDPPSSDYSASNKFCNTKKTKTQCGNFTRQNCKWANWNKPIISNWPGQPKNEGCAYTYYANM
jgi:hypothetical protein